MMPVILIADDNDENRYMLEVLLQRNGFETVTTRNGKEALEAAREGPPDLIVTDILMPVMDGFALCKEWKADERLNRVPFIFYTATYTDPKDVEFGLSLGAERFLLKPQEIEVLLRVFREVLAERGAGEAITLERPLGEEMELLRHYNEALFRKLEKKMADLESANRALQQEIEKRQASEANLRESEARLQTLLDTLPIGLACAAPDGLIQYVNGRFIELFGYTASDMPTIEAWFLRAYPNPMEREPLFSSWSGAMEAARRAGTTTPPFDVRVTCKDGSHRDVSVVGAILKDFHLVVFSDVTERKRLQAQLLQAQKLESIGNLAGGIAHDFNNVLTTVTGFAGLLQMNMQRSDPLMSYVNELASAGMRGAALTHQLLAFGRKQILDIRPIDLNEAITGLQKMLQRVIREDITLSFTACSGPLPVMADVNQIGQVVINLVTNARDAMPDGGPLLISTGVVEVDDTFITKHGCGEIGAYAVVTISDKGIGMDEETRGKIFEPFYTTKEVGRGTGLGLSVVYGIIQQHKGMVLVESVPGAGSRFEVYLPLLRRNIESNSRSAEETGHIGGSETILIAEDDEMIRALASDILKSQGYDVLTAENGEEAVALFRQQAHRIDLLIFDLIMPEKRGFDAYLEIAKEASSVKALFVTGYSEAEVERGELRRRELPLLLKPYTPTDLLRKVRELLDGKRAQ